MEQLDLFLDTEGSGAGAGGTHGAPPMHPDTPTPEAREARPHRE